MKKRCRDCKHYDLERAKSEGGRVMGDRVAQCMFPFPDLPDSFNELRRRHAPTASFMPPNHDAINCIGFIRL